GRKSQRRIKRHKGGLAQDKSHEINKMTNESLSSSRVVLKRWKGDKTPIYPEWSVKEFIQNIQGDIDKLPDKMQFKDSGTKIWVDYREVIKIIKKRAGDAFVDLESPDSVIHSPQQSGRKRNSADTPDDCISINEGESPETSGNHSPCKGSSERMKSEDTPDVSSTEGSTESSTELSSGTPSPKIPVMVSKDTPEVSDSDQDSVSTASGTHSPVYKRSKDTTPDGQPLRRAKSSGTHNSYVREWNKKNQDKVRKIVKKYRSKNPEKQPAWDKARRGIGAIKIEGLCQICEIEEATHRHHPDYSKPREVILICAKCHKDIHLNSQQDNLPMSCIEFKDDDTPDVKGTSDKIKFHCTCERGKCICNKSLNILGGTTVTHDKGCANIDLDEDKILFNWMVEIYGKRCLDFQKGCACCEAWVLYDKLIQEETTDKTFINKTQHIEETCAKCSTEENCIHKEHRIKPFIRELKK
ncbi:hypothetical protein LCGC14_2590020, partial [marine sediment metagenome]